MHLQFKPVRGSRGGGAGVSVRVARGVRVHLGGFQSRGTDVSSDEIVDMGILGVTTRHLYFAGAERRFRIRLDRIATIANEDICLRIERDVANAMPELFVLGTKRAAAELRELIWLLQRGVES